MVIYGLLNSQDSVQHVRISKGFLGEGNALIMAGESDSINYANVLEVKLERVQAGSVIQTFTMTRDESIPKDDGLFASPFQVFYKSNQPILADGSMYRLVVRNTESGNVASSLTRIVGDISIEHPVGQEADFSTPFFTTADFRPGANSKTFDMAIRFHFTENDSTGFIQQKYVDWNFAEQVASQVNNALVEFRYFRPKFFENLGANLSPQAGITRRVDNLLPGYKPVEFRFIVGSEDLHIYNQLTQPGSGLTLDKPVFTTIENGIGLFSSRLIKSRFFDLKAETKAAFDTSAFTRNLNFQF